MSAVFSMDPSALIEAAERFLPAGAAVEDAVNEVLHGPAADIIADRISPLIHPSGRTFKGHRASAAASHWHGAATDRNLEVTVRAVRRFGYLYFPDDGSNTRRHAGGQRFMERGAEAAAERIAGLCIDNIINRTEGR